MADHDYNKEPTIREISFPDGFGILIRNEWGADWPDPIHAVMASDVVELSDLDLEETSAGLAGKRPVPVPPPPPVPPGPAPDPTPLPYDPFARRAR